MRWPRRFNWLLGIIAGLWLAMIVAGLSVLAAYAGRSGATGRQPDHWPADSSVSRDASRWTLVLALHPQCGCSRATMENLNRLLARCEGRLAVRVMVIRPAEATDGWEKTDLWRSAATLPGVVVQTDINGTEAERFGASTSGQAVLYDPTGRMRFRGGLTASRGHAGDNAGCDAIAMLINGEAAETASTSVFGCSLFGGELAERQTK